MTIPDEVLPLLPRSSGAPCARILSNGRLTTLLTAAGTGYTNFEWRRVTSWTPDPVEDRDGVFLYLRDEDDAATWSLGLEPVAGAPDHYEVSAGPGRVRIERNENGIEAECEIVVTADVDADLRRLRLRNPGPRSRRLSVTTYAGLVLFHPGGHAGHPGFSKLFVETSADPGAGVLLARRRPRGEAPEPLHLAHALVGPGAASFETDRARFVGRGASLARPAALERGAALSGTAGNVLDPIVSWRRELELAPGASVELVCVLAVGSTESEARALLARFAEPGAFDAARAGAERRAWAELERCALTPAQGDYLQALLAAMLYGARELRAPADVFRRARGTPDDLWIFGLPPDQPLALVESGAAAGVLGTDLAAAISYWSGLGVTVRGLALGGGATGSDAIVTPKPDAEPRALDSARACARLVLIDAWPRLAVPAAGAAPKYRPSDARGARRAARATRAPLRERDWRLHARRQRVRDRGERRRRRVRAPADAVGERAREPGLRGAGHRARQRLHVEPQLARAPAHPVVERSDPGSPRRSASGFATKRHASSGRRSRDRRRQAHPTRCATASAPARGATRATASSRR